MVPMLFFSAIMLLVAPPPKPVVPEGRITIWVGETFVHMKPDGTDVTAVKVSKASPVQRGDGININSKNNTAVYSLTTSSGKGWFRAKVCIASLTDDGDTQEIKGFVPNGTILSADGKTVYFSGVQAEEFNKETYEKRANLAYDIASKKVMRLPMPVCTGISAVTDDEKWVLAVGRTKENNVETLRTYLVSMDGKIRSEPFRPNTLVGNVSFSPLGDRYTAYAMAFDELVGDGVRGDKPPKYLLVDRLTTVRMPIENLPSPDEIRVVRWNPAGTKIGYLWEKQVVRDPKVQAIPGEETQFDYKVFVANPDGSNAKTVYETTSGRYRAFMWK